jgi:hypothetical protein
VKLKLGMVGGGRGLHRSGPLHCSTAGRAVGFGCGRAPLILPGLRSRLPNSALQPNVAMPAMPRWPSPRQPKPKPTQGPPVRRGIQLIESRWSAMIRVKDPVTGDSTNKHLGVFDTEAEAFKAYVEAKE